MNYRVYYLEWFLEPLGPSTPKTYPGHFYASLTCGCRYEYEPTPVGENLVQHPRELPCRGSHRR